MVPEALSIWIFASKSGKGSIDDRFARFALKLVRLLLGLLDDTLDVFDTFLYILVALHFIDRPKHVDRLVNHKHRFLALCILV